MQDHVFCEIYREKIERANKPLFSRYPFPLEAVLDR